VELLDKDPALLGMVLRDVRRAYEVASASASGK
jgi:hypothetical protein